MLSSTVIMGILPNEQLQTSARSVRRRCAARDRRRRSDRHQRVRRAQVARLARRLDAARRAIGAGRGRRRHVSARLRAPEPPRRARRRAADHRRADDDRAVRDAYRRRSPVSSTTSSISPSSSSSCRTSTRRWRSSRSSTTGSCRAATFQTYKWIALVAVVYCLWAVIGGDPGDRRARDRRTAHQRAAVSVLHPLDGGGRETPLRGARRARTIRRDDRIRPGMKARPDRRRSLGMQTLSTNTIHIPRQRGRKAAASCALAALVSLTVGSSAAFGQDDGARERAAAGPAAAEGARLEVQLRRGPRWVRLRELAVHESEAGAALGRPVRQLVRRIAQAGGDRGLHDLEHSRSSTGS